jgi:hypothetical protein
MVARVGDVTDRVRMNVRIVGWLASVKDTLASDTLNKNVDDTTYQKTFEEGVQKARKV